MIVFTKSRKNVFVVTKLKMINTSGKNQNLGLLIMKESRTEKH